MLRVATWNVNSLKVRLEQVLEWSAANKPDLLALQETKTLDENFPLAEIEAAGYQALFNGQKTYNGVAILSRLAVPPSRIETGIPAFDDPQRRVLAASFGELRIINAYIPNGAVVGSEKFAYKLRWLEKLTTWLKLELEQHAQLILLGDFNIAPEDRDVYDPEAWQGSVLVSPQERAEFQQLEKLGLHDCFRLFESGPENFSWWDYRAAAFRRNRGLRVSIDGQPAVGLRAYTTLRDVCVRCHIDKQPRGWERPSDHAPVVAEFTL